MSGSNSCSRKNKLQIKSVCLIRSLTKVCNIPAFLGHVTLILWVCRFMGMNSKDFWALQQLGLKDRPEKTHMVTVSGGRKKINQSICINLRSTGLKVADVSLSISSV